MKTYVASLNNLREMLQFIKDNATEAKFSESEILKIELAVEEALVNIINYGYPNVLGEISLQCTINKNEGMRIVIKDESIPYNPLTNPKIFNPKSPLESGDVGGYGIFFILKIMDEVKYDRYNEFNILTLTKYADDRSGADNNY